MRYDDASQAGSTANDSAPVARPDVDALAPGSFGPAGGNAITGAGTTTGASGQDTVADAPGHIVAVQGAGGAAANAGGTFQANGQYGVLSMDADGNFNYVRNAGTPDGVQDVFNYTLADADGQTSSTTLTIDIAKGGTGQAALNPGTGIVIPGVVNLPAGVQMSNIHVRGSDLIIDMPDGTQMVIPNGAVFVPQLVIGDVELPATNLAALLVDSEGPQAGAGQLLSSGGNFDVPVPPLDPGVPLGDLIPPTELAFPQPEFVPEGQFIDKKPEAGDISVQLDDDDIPGRGGNPGGPGDDNGSPNAIASGTLPGSGGDAPISWSVAGVTLPSTGGFSTVAGPGGSILVQQAQTGGTVTVLTITVNAATGAFTVTENNPIMHPAGDAENNVSFVINYNVTDVDGDVAAGTLTVNVDDDTPTVSVQAGPDAEVILTTHDALSIPGDGNPDSATTSANFGGVFSGSTISPGADGAGPGTSSTYVLAVTAQNSGLTSHGATINLFVVSGVVVGTTATSSGAINAGNTIFTVSTDNSGVVTLTQFFQIDHPIGQDPTPTGTPFADQIISMADGLVTLTRNITVVDNDGDQVTGSASVNIGANLHFTDDGPTIGLADHGEPTLTVDETDLATNDSASFAANFAANFGADGPAATGNGFTYALSVSASGADSGLIDSQSGNHVFLFVENGQVVGREGTSSGAAVGGPVVFTVSVDVTGTVTLDQSRAVIHGTPSNPDTSEGVTLASDGLVVLTATATDFDGDTASQPLNIGTNLIFNDDGPSIGAGGTQPSLTVDETNLSQNDSASFAGIFTGISFGNDGPASSNATTYSLGISAPGADSGLVDSVSGNHVFLFLEGGAVVGREGTNAGTAAAGPIVFTASIDSAGVVTLDQSRAVIHGTPSSPDTSEGVTLGADNLVTITAVVTDKDGDQASATANIGQNLNFLDDGPSVNASSTQPNLTVDETTLAINDTQSFASVFSGSFGNDGPASANATTYALTISASGQDSGLIDSQSGNHVFLFVESGVVVGREGTNAGTAAAGPIVFTVSVNSTGDVTLDQSRAVIHGLGTNPDTSEGVTLSADNFVMLSATLTDKDGDQATATANIGQNLNFLDDGPSVIASTTQPTLTVDETNLATNDSASFASVFTPSFGNDGPASSNSTTYTLGISASGADSGLIDTVSGNHVFLFVESGQVVGREGTNAGTAAAGPIVFVVSVNSGGTVTLDQQRAVIHGTSSNPDTSEPVTLSADTLVTLTATVTDKDGDQATATANIGQNLNFLDDGPIAHNDTDSTGGIGTTATGNVITGVDHAGGDANSTDGVADSVGADTPGHISAIASVNVPGNLDTDASANFQINGQYGTLTLLANGDYTYTRTGGPGGATDVFTYTLQDADGDTSTATLTITLADSAPVATTAAATVDDDGLAGANTAAAGTGGDIDANVGESPPSASEAVYNGLLGSSSAGDGPATFLFLASLNGTTATVGQETVTYSLTGAVTGGFTTLTATGPRGVLFTVTITNQATGAYTVTLVDNVLHPTLNGLSGDDGENGTSTFVVVPYQMRDSDGDNSASPGQLTITFNDDVPVANNDTDSVVAGTLGPATGNVLTGVDHAGPDANSTDGVADSFGADGASSPAIIALTSNNVPGNADNDGSLNFAVIGQYGSLALNVNGDYTYTRFAGTPGGVSDVFTYTIQDADGDKTTATLTINIGDSQPVAADGVAAVDDDGLSGGNPASTTGDIDANAGEAAPVNSSEAIFHGQLVATGGDTNSFSFASMNGTSGTVGTETVHYAWNAGTNTLTATIFGGARDGTALFNVVVNPTTGSYNLTLLDNVLHAAGGNETSAPTVNLTFTVTDLDGDSDTGNIAVTFNDDAPTMTHASNINIQNSGDVAASGTFSFNLGADGGAANNNVITSVTGSATVNSNAVTNYTISETSENATTAVYTFSFDYPNGSGTTAHETGTLTFDKVAGTYTVDLADPISGFSILATAGAPASAFINYNLNASTTSNSPSEVATVQLANNFFLQFSGVYDKTGSDHQSTVSGDTTYLNGTSTTSAQTSTFSSLDLFSQANATVTVSSSAAGVAGNTIQGGEVLDFNLYTTDKQGFIGTAPNQSAGTMFISLDGIGGSEDMIIVLKLLDTSTGKFETVALMVQNGDIITQSTAGQLTGTPYASIALDSNDGLIIIEPNDYQNGNTNLVIVGAQIAGSDDGISGTAANFNGTVGGSGGSDFVGTQAFSTDVSDQPFKIQNIGFITNTTTDQTAHLEFNVTVSDADGDTVSQTITADVTNNPDSSTPIFPVVLDLNGDGVHFLGTDAGVHYDYGNGSVATAWASPQDGILAVDANHDGTVTNASEFVFGGNGTTDLQALAAYDTNHDGQLTSADAGFSNFVVWQDANSNGVADAGEVQTLAARGITAISLSSDGISYTAANGDVLVAGTGSYTNADGSTGSLADAIFQTAAKDASDSLKSSTAMSSNAALIGAIAAAGLAASEPLAAHGISDHSSALSGLNDAVQHTQAFAPVALDASASNDVSSDLIGQSSSGKSTAAVQTALSHADDNSQASATLDSAASHSDGPALSQLSQGTAAPASDAPSALTAGGIAMPSAALLMAAAAAHGGVAGDGQHNQVVSQVLADALHGGQGGPDISALVNAATGGGQGPTIGDALASHAGGAVPIGDMAIFTGFTGLHSLAIMEQMAVHVDAASAHA